MWSFKCRYYFYIHGPYGVSNCIERMPFHLIIKYLRKYGASIGDDCRIETGIILHRPDKQLPFKNLTLGKNIYIGRKSIIDLTEKVIFEDYSAIGAYCQIWTHKGTSLFPPYSEVRAQVTLKCGVVCYSGVLVSPGVTIGSHSSIGANSVVNSNIPPDCFCAGLPAKKIRDNTQKN